MKSYSLGRVVGSKIRNGDIIPTDFTGWLNGDIFILNGSNDIPYYEYNGEELIELGKLKGPQGIQGEQGPKGLQGFPGTGLAEISKEVIILPDDINDSVLNEITTPGIYKLVDSTHKNLLMCVYSYKPSELDTKNIIQTIIDCNTPDKYLDIIKRHYDGTNWSVTRLTAMEKNYYHIVSISIEDLIDYDLDEVLYDSTVSLTLQIISKNNRESLTIDDVWNYIPAQQGYPMNCVGYFTTKDAYYPIIDLERYNSEYIFLHYLNVNSTIGTIQIDITKEFELTILNSIEI